MEKILVKCKANELTGFTHTSLKPQGAYFINEKNKDNFYKIYHNVLFNKKKPLHITEAPDKSGYSQLKVDIDYNILVVMIVFLVLVAFIVKRFVFK